MRKRRDNINGKMLKKSNTTENLLFLTRSRVAIEEFSQMLDGDERTANDDWFDDLDNRLKRKISRSLKSAEVKIEVNKVHL